LLFLHIGRHHVAVADSFLASGSLQLGYSLLRLNVVVALRLRFLCGHRRFLNAHLFRSSTSRSALLLGSRLLIILIVLVELLLIVLLLLAVLSARLLVHGCLLRWLLLWVLGRVLLLRVAVGILRRLLRRVVGLRRLHVIAGLLVGLWWLTVHLAVLGGE
jgi:hypothetical protein